ncbi:MAG: ABC-2 family transporter protein [Chloroflexota bacterium]
MRKYLFIIQQSFQRALAYRASFVLGLGVPLLQVAALYYFWTAVYAGATRPGGLSRHQMITYLCVAFAVNQLVGWGVETSIGRAIRDGSIATELLKPLDYQLYKLCEASGYMLLQGLLIALLTFALAIWLLGIAVPATLVNLMLFLLSVALGVLVAFSLSYVTGLAFFWTTNWWGLTQTKRWLVDMLSGALVPLVFFPEWLRGIALALPFQAIVHTPLTIYLGLLPEAGRLQALLAQLFWAVALWFAARLLFAQAIKRVTVQGG